jgi:hypothetical protein
MHPVDVIGYAAVAVNIGVYLMRTMIPLRIFAIVTNALFIAYSYSIGVYPTLVLNCILLPLNLFRLGEMVLLVRRTRVAATHSDFDLGFIRPYTARRAVSAGEQIFAKGESAAAMYIVESGVFELPESAIELSAGSLVGELGLLAPGGVRTQSLVCKSAGTLRVLNYQQFRQLFFQNPTFGFYFLQLTTGRLFQNIDALERALAIRGLPDPIDNRVPGLG